MRQATCRIAHTACQVYLRSLFDWAHAVNQPRRIGGGTCGSGWHARRLWRRVVGFPEQSRTLPTPFADSMACHATQPPLHRMKLLDAADLRPEFLIGESASPLSTRSLLACSLARRSVMPKSSFIWDPLRSGKTWELVRQYREALRQCSPLAPRERILSRSGTSTLDRTLWLAPNARAAAQVRGQLLADGLEACLRPGVVTFDELTSASSLPSATDASGRRSVRCSSASYCGESVRQAIEETTLTFFADAAGRAGFIDCWWSTFASSSARNISPDRVRESSPTARQPAAARELAPTLRRLRTAVARARPGPTPKDRTGLPAMRWPPGRAAGSRISIGRRRRLHRFHAHAARNPAVCWRKRTYAACSISLPGEMTAVSGTRATAICSRKLQATLAELARDYPQVGNTTARAAALAGPALDHWRSTSFAIRRRSRAAGRRDRLAQSAGNRRGRRAHDEIVQIARRIKQRLTFRQRRSPGDIVGRVPLAGRRRAAGSRSVRSIRHSLFPRNGPADLIAAADRQDAAGAAAAGREDWPFRRVVSVLTNNTLTAIDDRARQAADWLVRDLQIAEGRGKLLERVEQLAAVDTPLDELGEHARRRVDAAKTALSCISHCCPPRSTNCPQKQPPAEWSRCAREQLGAKLGLAPLAKLTAGARRSSSPGNALQKHFAALERLDGWLDEPARL